VQLPHGADFVFGVTELPRTSAQSRAGLLVDVLHLVLAPLPQCAKFVLLRDSVNERDTGIVCLVLELFHVGLISRQTLLAILLVPMRTRF
jgi:hypothetical protein